MPTLTIDGQTDIGKVRDENQDAIIWHTDMDRPYGYFALADGMGGYAGGAAAAKFVVEFVDDRFKDLCDGEFLAMSYTDQLTQLRNSVARAISDVHRSLIEYKANARAEWSKMGSTLVLGVIWHNYAIVAHVGDSRAYLWDQRQLLQLTKDHSLVQQLIDSGELGGDQALSSQISNVVTQAIGINETLEPGYCEFTLEFGGVLLACSDGLTEYVSAQELANEMACNLPLMQSCFRLIEISNTRGGKDNISVVMAQLVR